MQQMRKLGMDAQFISGDGTTDPEFIKIAGNAAEGTLCTYSPSVDKLPSAKNFLKTYMPRWGEIGPYSVYSYDATGDVVGSHLRDGFHRLRQAGVQAALHQVQGARGEISFDEKGDLTTAPYIMWQVRGGKFVPCE